MPDSISVPEIDVQHAPFERLSPTSADGTETLAFMRRPPGLEPSLPVLIFLHGGLVQRTREALKKTWQTNPNQSRFLAAGYIVVTATFRSREADLQNPATLADCVAITRAVKELEGVDPQGVVVWGDSGGGSLALELAGELSLCAVAVQEPATVLLTGLMHGKGREGRKATWHKLLNPQDHYSEDVRAFTRSKLSRISCPLFFASGGVHPVNRINHEIIIPELLELGKEVKAALYPGQPHGFSHGLGDPAMTLKFFTDAHAFFCRHLPTPPQPVGPRFVSTVNLSPQRGS